MEDVKKWLTNRRISEVECLVPDITGNARGKFIPAKKFIKQESRLPESILIQTVTGEYTSEHYEIVSETDSDMFLEPDVSTIREVPWADERTALIIHDCYLASGQPHPLSTRNVLKKVLELYQTKNLTPVVAPEVEFFLVAQNTDPDYELTPPVGRSGRRESARQSYSIDAVNEFEKIIDQMYDYCEKMELGIDTLIHESGAAQFEVNFLHGDPLKLADEVFLFKRVVREIALSNGVYATFMAKPMRREPGSSMHIHQSLVDSKTGLNAFATKEGKYSSLFFSYIAGLQKYGPSALPFFAPNVNSYRRFAPDNSAPINFDWGYDNRTTGLRVPESTPDGFRVENRLPGSDANPYLAFAATLACGYLGITEKLQAAQANEGNAYTQEITLARNLEESLRLLNKCEPLCNILGADFAYAYSAVKRNEYEAFNEVISSWEREFLLLSV
ncbi:glutamine synthetase family protein [Aliiglaciecola sp. CAU 1673]|uniref:glutamine synthetase family protein n=1 Tax=Aliiglaciecola sp. CAU 1673 TaxID=3032595 RepID=UPI0023DBC6E0|nr:glutamine synthetase family protein [Aliiglaciecola sp. CAU 1673]MDF2177064.1 glutamine synthetase family protein [Aliiglaciecola sp. CAU 1673]